MRIFLIALVPMSSCETKIQSKPATAKYADNWDSIFNKSPLSEITRGLTENQVEQREVEMPSFKLKSLADYTRQRQNLH